jgi:5-methyltetrahydrofolate--homocysteine methyltransferase
MTTPALLELARERTVLLDGALGTELMARGLPQGTPPEAWNLENPDGIKAVHRAYFDAGADAVTTNSFGATRINLAAHGLESRAVELNLAAAALARAAAPAGKFVLGSMGPTGKFLKPQGPFSEPDFEAAFEEQAAALAAGGVDALLVETQYDLRETLCAVRAARRAAPSLPVLATMTFNAFPRGFFTIMGDGTAKCAAALEEAGVAALGANCSLTSEQMVGAVRSLRQSTSLPLIAQANAGKPVLGSDGCVTYSQSLEDYVRFIPAVIEAGAGLVGGCCGTSPAFIRAMAGILRRRQP